MIDSAYEEAVDRFLSAFFDRSPAELKAGFARPTTRTMECSARWVKRLRDHQEPVVLPRKKDRDSPLQYYVVCRTREQFLAIREELTAFVGPTYARFFGEPVPMDPNDPAEAAILAFTDQPVLRFEPGPSRETRQAVVDALCLMVDVRSAQERRGADDARPTGRVLREFYLALGARDRVAAEEALRYLRTRHRLEPLNLEFLEVQLRAELGAWEEIVQLRQFPDLVQARRPPAVSRALLTALYRVHLAALEAAGDPSAAAERFRDEVLPQSGSLFDSRAGLSDPDVLKLFMLFAVADTPPRSGLRDEILALTPGLPAEDAAYLTRLAAALPITEPNTTPASVTRDVIEAARRALEEYELDTALELALAAPASVERVRILLQCADEVPTGLAREEAARAVEALDACEREQLLRFRANREIWERVRGAVPQAAATVSLPRDWCDWMEWWDRDGVTSAWLLKTATEGAETWPLDGLEAEPERVVHLAAHLSRQAGSELLHLALPHLLRSFQGDPHFPRRAFQPLYDLLRISLVYGAPTGLPVEFALLNDLCQAAFHLGLDETRYRKMVEDVETFWAAFASPASLQGMLDILDQFAYFHCADHGKRRQLAVKVISDAVPWVLAGRLDREEWRYLQLLATELQLTALLQGVDLPAEEPGESRPASDPLCRLRGVVGIYTLTESAAKRAQLILSRRCPRCTVKLSHATDGSRPLAELAQNANLFVMVAASATHAATGFIERYRSDKPLLRPAGKGTSSILRCLSEYLREHPEYPPDDRSDAAPAVT